MDQSTPYARLSPDTILEAVDSLGLTTDGTMLALNSYENRVYQVGIEEASPVIAKFYRPERWTDEQILEEHQFTLELVDAEIPVVPPNSYSGQTLHRHDDFRFALFERQGGWPPELESDETLTWLGRFLGRIHAVGRRQPFRHRPELTRERFGRESVSTLIEGGWIPAHLESAFVSLTGDLLQAVDAAFERAGGFERIRLHGDCHPGNILWREGPWFVDMDDCQTGPAIQDLWMLMSGSRTDMEAQLATLLDGYQAFCTFDQRELHLVEALRSLRVLHHHAWIARRWDDPAFPLAFPWFDQTGSWEQLILSLREQLAEVQEAPLTVW